MCSAWPERESGRACRGAPSKSDLQMNRTGSTGWLFQRASGALIFVLVAVHFALMHYMGPEKRLYADVARRFANPLWKTFDIVFLAAAVPHGWYGVWGSCRITSAARPCARRPSSR